MDNLPGASVKSQERPDRALTKPIAESLPCPRACLRRECLAGFSVVPFSILIIPSPRAGNFLHRLPIPRRIVVGEARRSCATPSPGTDHSDSTQRHRKEASRTEGPPWQQARTGRGSSSSASYPFLSEPTSPQAADAREIHFNQLHAECHSRIQYKKTCPLHGEVRNEREVAKPTAFEDQAPRSQPSAEELDLTKRLIRASTAKEFDFAAYKDARTRKN